MWNTLSPRIAAPLWMHVHGHYIVRGWHAHCMQQAASSVLMAGTEIP